MARDPALPEVSRLAPLHTHGLGTLVLWGDKSFLLAVEGSPAHDAIITYRYVGRYLWELRMPDLTMQEEGLTKGTSCPSHCPSSGAS